MAETKVESTALNSSVGTTSHGRHDNLATTFVSFCPYSTLRSTCPDTSACPLLHFERSVRPHTQVGLGDCSYLNMCHRMNRCRYVHYTIEDPLHLVRALQGKDVCLRSALNSTRTRPNRDDEPPSGPVPPEERVYPGQWINADLRVLDFSVLGKFDVLVADPPWAIHQELPYGTLTDDEMLRMPVGSLQDQGGLLFLWVTGRAMELGRDCLDAWGYERIDELVWVKTNQLQGLIRTGRTGHWLNHSKEHCLVAIRRSPTSSSSSGSTPIPPYFKQGLDTQVILSEVRETSRKPDELYDMIERIVPPFLEVSPDEHGAGTVRRRSRKAELFGRIHNVREGWLTIGNQLGTSDQLYEKELWERLNLGYEHSCRLGTDKCHTKLTRL
ncbi:BZ3500_MvSof-1268-A1-R1_Chr11-1g03224 [Microbotryum saponariae]|uniref:mRNA m(6)A methyltransferase n=1 Tax=Microbotryum saponariae TaxID=289078 RepID=A0A2X0LA94_9BASI|nr:BZ3501_MvSof-1269-A2-R1_Chr11g02799 [Microbotryum saponariae]SDA03784.1 BZ3500_MvSof-1268-A1-R1_Chr11-1g03224 [Microbotryum saponariae]